MCQKDANEESKDPAIVSHIAVYVDDLMVVGKREAALEVMEELAKVFSMTKPEEVTRGKEVTFCGYQIKKTETGYALHQTKYVEEVLKKHNIKKSESVPCHRITDEPDEQEPSREDIRIAQVLTGELGWVTSRTRPDIAFAVSIMARMIHKRPKWVKETGLQVMRYLYGTTSWGLNYTKIEEPEVLNILVDASYAPPHEGYRSVQGAIYMHGNNILMWSSSRQSFITQSTAESELLAYNESAQGKESIAHLLGCFNHKVARRLIGDSKSGLVQLTGEVGSWRTRHLRLRSAKLRELIQNGVDGWHAVHRDGKDLAADGMTKPLIGQAFYKFRDMIHMKNCQEDEAGDEDVEPSFKVCGVQTGLSLKEVGCGLVGAGAARVTTGNRKLAMALVASGVALYVNGGKRPASKAIEQRPHKSPENEGGKGQKQEGKGGAAHLKEGSRAGTTEEVSNLMRTQDLVLGSTTPGLRALRKDKDPTRRGADGAEDNEGALGRAASRGKALVAAMSSETGQRDDRKELDRQLQDLTRMVSEMKVKKEEEETGGYQSVVTDGMQRALVPESRPFIPSPGQPERPSSSGDGAGKGTTSRRTTSTRKDGYDESATEMPKTDAKMEKSREEMAAKCPWELPEFSRTPVGTKDKWYVELTKYGWLVRVHAKMRKRKFHPVHSTAPVLASDLQGERVTVRHLAFETKDRSTDLWYEDRRTQDDHHWRGFTFLRIVENAQHPPDLPESDGSYEVVKP